MGLSSAEASASKYTSAYDKDFQAAVDRFKYPVPWQWLKAQCYQESRLDPTAVSRAKAKGLCQFMDPTWEEVTGKLRLRASPFNPRANTLAAAYYMSWLASQWSAPRPPLDRLKLTQASYNAGFGSLLRFQKACNGAVTWAKIEPCITYKETRDYVRLIQKHFDELGGSESDG